MASYYGNESGSRTASGQRMNANAMTADAGQANAVAVGTFAELVAEMVAADLVTVSEEHERKYREG